MARRADGPIEMSNDEPTAVITEPAVTRRAAEPGTPPASRARSQALLPFLAAAVLVVAWQVLAQVFSLPIYIAPTPIQIAKITSSRKPSAAMASRDGECSTSKASSQEISRPCSRRRLSS